jgi:hypothetical protein
LNDWMIPKKHKFAQHERAWPGAVQHLLIPYMSGNRSGEIICISMKGRARTLINTYIAATTLAKT